MLLSHRTHLITQPTELMIAKHTNTYKTTTHICKIYILHSTINLSSLSFLLFFYLLFIDRFGSSSDVLDESHVWWSNHHNRCHHVTSLAVGHLYPATAIIHTQSDRRCAIAVAATKCCSAGEQQWPAADSHRWWWTRVYEYAATFGSGGCVTYMCSAKTTAATSAATITTNGWQRHVSGRLWRCGMYRWRQFLK